MTDLSYDYSGKTAVVTGGANGIGAEIARHFHMAGAMVAIWDLSEPVGLDVPHTYCRVDVSSAAQIDTAVAATMGECGQIDYLSHNAGFSGSTVPVSDGDPEEWQRIIDVNLVGTYRVCRAVLPGMKQRNFGRIVNMASLAGKEGTPNASAYSASKAGVIAFTKSLGKELAETDIRVNSIAPAAIETSLLDQMTPTHVQTMIDKSPMKRLGRVEEAAALVMWLCSSACSFNTGAVFDLSGGRATY